ncbi:hypothetical protein [Roseibium album]|uniref:hypothetical protein n=1 Tax=Roseibium album TaxID=311410 RepID=UPI00391C8129
MASTSRTIRHRTLGSFNFDASALTATTQLLSETGSFSVGDTLTLTDGNGYRLGSLEIETHTTVADLESFADDFQGVSTLRTSSGKLSITSQTTCH